MSDNEILSNLKEYVNAKAMTVKYFDHLVIKVKDRSEEKIIPAKTYIFCQYTFVIFRD